MNNPLPSTYAGSQAPFVGGSEGFDLAGHLLRHPHDSFYVKVVGDSMQEDHLFDGDILIVDKTVEAKPSDIIVTQAGDGFILKKYQREQGNLHLVPTSPDPPGESARICGVAIFAIHKL